MRSQVLAVVFLSLMAAAGPVQAQSVENVALVINENSAASKQIGEYYARTRGVPSQNVFRIHTTTDESIERAEYLETIESPIAAAIRRAGLQDRILYLVLTRGIPIRIEGTQGLEGTESSVDSELTLLYRRMTSQGQPVEGYIENPYFLGARPIAEAKRFTHREQDIYLVTRLDAFTTQEALSLIDRAGQPAGSGTIVLDQRAAAEGPDSGDEWMQRAADRLREQGLAERVLLETTPERAHTEAPVLGFSSWGSADPANRVRVRGLSFVPGAIAANVASFGARTFVEPPWDWKPSASPDKGRWHAGASDALIGDLIREGVTGVAGQVGEAYLLGAVRPDILFPAYLSGFNLAEAFYLATPVLGWQQVVVGDPLAAVTSRQRLTREELEDPEDPATLLPGLFSARRLAAAHIVSPEQPDEVLSGLLRAETLTIRGDAAGARAALAAAIERAPDSPALLLTLASLEDQAAAYDNAIARYRRVVELQPDNVIALNNLAYALAVRKKQPKDAIEFARRAASLAPRAGTVLDTTGWIEHLLENDEAAAALLDRAVKLAPNRAEIRLHAALVLAAVGRLDDSKKHLAEALRLDPSLKDRPEVAQLQRQQ